MKIISVLLLAAMTSPMGLSQSFIYDFWHNYRSSRDTGSVSWTAEYVLYPDDGADGQTYYIKLQTYDANGHFNSNTVARFLAEGKNLRFAVATQNTTPIIDARLRMWGGPNCEVYLGTTDPETVTTHPLIAQHYGEFYLGQPRSDMTTTAVVVDDSVPEALIPITVNWNGQQLFVSGSLVNLDPDQHIYGILITDGRGIVISQKSFAAQNTYVFDSTQSILNRCDTAPYKLEALTADGWHTVGIYNRSGAGCLAASSECGYECGNPHDEIDDGGILICWDCFDDFY